MTTYTDCAGAVDNVFWYRCTQCREVSTQTGCSVLQFFHRPFFHTLSLSIRCCFPWANSTLTVISLWSRVCFLTAGATRLQHIMLCTQPYVKFHSVRKVICCQSRLPGGLGPVRNGTEDSRSHLPPSMDNVVRSACCFNTRLVHSALYNSSHALAFVIVLPSNPRFTQDDPYVTYFYLDENAAGNTDIDAIIVMDGISDAWVSPRSTYMWPYSYNI